MVQKMTNDFIFRNDQSIYAKEGPSSDSQESLYTLIGLESFLDDDDLPRTEDTNKVFAKKVSRSNGTTKYMIRLESSGKLFNPVSIYGAEQQKTFLDRICRSDKRFKEVSSKTFAYYIKFLTTKNTSLLYNAEREDE